MARPTKGGMGKLLARLEHLDSHYRLILALVAAAVAFVVTIGQMVVSVQTIVVWDVFCLSSLALAWIRMIWAEPATCAKSARLQDSGRTFIFLLVVIGTCASLFAVAFLLGTAKSLSGGRVTWRVALAATTVLASWSLMHTAFGLHYAHVYYRKSEDDKGEADHGGLKFPGEPRPDFMDFGYFSFVIGMTCQVSDVQVTSRRMRRLALIHGVLSFVYNTAILALSINIISTLL